jgi:hypothetical protein
VRALYFAKNLGYDEATPERLYTRGAPFFC